LILGIKNSETFYRKIGNNNITAISVLNFNRRNANMSCMRLIGYFDAYTLIIFTYEPSCRWF